MNYKYKIITGILFLFVFINTVTGQRVSHINKLPWVKGILPLPPIGTYYKVIRTNGASLEEARKQSMNSLVLELASEQGVEISAKSINTIESSDLYSKDTSNYKESQSNRHIVRIEKGSFKANFTSIEEYYEYENGSYNLYKLYLISSTHKSLDNIPTLSYKLNKGAWRALFFPGLAQFYTGQTLKGLMFVAGEASFLGGFFFLDNKSKFYLNRMSEASDIDTKLFYRKKADNYKNYRNISLGLAIGFYIYNIVDAYTSKKGRLSYSINKKEISFNPIINIEPYSGVFAMGISMNF